MKVNKYNGSNKNFEKKLSEYSSICNEKKGFYDNILESKIKNRASLDVPWTKYYTHDQLSSNIVMHSIFEHLYDYGKDHLNETALIYPNLVGEKKYSYKKLFKMIDNVCISILKLGVKNEDIVTVSLPNTVEAIVIIYALSKLGIVINMMHPLASLNEIKDNINFVKSKYVFMHHGTLKNNESNIDKFYEILNATKLKKIIIVNPSDEMPTLFNKIYTQKADAFTKFDYKNNECFISWKDFYKLSKKGKSKIVDKYFSSYLIDPSKCALLLSTGGTTGTSKLVQLSHNNVNACAESIIIDNEKMIPGKDVTLMALPLFHGFGLINSLHMSLCSGVKVVIVTSYEAKKYAEYIKKYKISVLIGVPAMFTGLMKFGKHLNLSRIKYFVYGGDKMSKKTRNELNLFLKNHKAKTCVLPGYGLSEAGGALIKAKEDDILVDKKSDKGIEGINIGIPLPHTKVMIYNVKTKSEVAGYYKEGLICACGPSVGLGYYKNLEETKISYFLYEKEIWLNTGDIGYMDKDGSVFFTGRLKELIISNGYNIYPIQIESLMVKFPIVTNSAAIGVPHDYKGEVPILLIEIDTEKTYIDYKKLRNEIKNECKLNLPGYAQPEKILFMDKFPQTKMKKLDKVTLKNMYLKGKIEY